MMNDIIYDVIVIGAGQAGCEAARAAVKAKRKTLLLTPSLDSIALFHEDAYLPEGWDKAEKKELLLTEAVKQAMFAKVLTKRNDKAEELILIDRRIIHVFSKHFLEKMEDLTIKQTIITSIRKKEDFEVNTRFKESYKGKTVVLTAGTMLKKQCLPVEQKTYYKKYQDPVETNVEKCIDGLDLKIRKKLISISPRISRKTLKRSQLKTVEVKSKKSVRVVAFQIKLNKGTIDIIKREIKKLQHGEEDLAADWMKAEELCGNEYIILPESSLTEEMNITALKICLPEESQIRVINAIKELSSAKITRPGYDILWNYIDSKEKDASLETKQEGLFLAGEVLGTEGLVCAALQGRMAGANASLRSQGKIPLKST